MAHKEIHCFTVVGGITRTIWKYVAAAAVRLADLYFLRPIIEDSDRSRAFIGRRCTPESTVRSLLASSQ